jgi:hypothetical protein
MEWRSIGALTIGPILRPAVLEFPGHFIGPATAPVEWRGRHLSTRGVRQEMA